MTGAASMWPFLPWAGGLVMGAALGGLYSGLETGVYALNKIRLDLRAEAGLRSARRLRRLLRNPNNVLAVLLIGTNASGYFATFCVASMFVLAGYGAAAKWYTIALATPLLFVFAEAVPKGVFGRLAERAVYRFAWFLSASNRLFLACGASGVLRGFGAALMALVGRRGGNRSLFGHEGISAVVAEGRASGVLTHFQSVMADRVAHLGGVTLGDVMVPMARVASAPAPAGPDALLDILREHNHSRLPLLEAGRVTGVLDVYDVLIAGGGAPPAEKAAPPVCLPAGTSVTDALCRMQRAGAVLAVVEDGGRHVGIATVKDLVEEIVGELEAW